jgi:hypothetical protein
MFATAMVPSLYVEEIGMEFNAIFPQTASMVAVSAGCHVLE